MLRRRCFLEDDAPPCLLDLEDWVRLLLRGGGSMTASVSKVVLPLVSGLPLSEESKKRKTNAI